MARLPPYNITPMGIAPFPRSVLRCLLPDGFFSWKTFVCCAVLAVQDFEASGRGDKTRVTPLACRRFSVPLNRGDLLPYRQRRSLKSHELPSKLRRTSVADRNANPMAPSVDRFKNGRESRYLGKVISRRFGGHGEATFTSARDEVKLKLFQWPMIYFSTALRLGVANVARALVH